MTKNNSSQQKTETNALRNATKNVEEVNNETTQNTKNNVTKNSMSTKSVRNAEKNDTFGNEASNAVKSKKNSATNKQR